MIIKLTLSEPGGGINYYTCPTCKVQIGYKDKNFPPVICGHCFDEIAPGPLPISSSELVRICNYRRKEGKVI